MQIRIAEISTAMCATTDIALTKTIAAVVTKIKIHPAGIVFRTSVSLFLQMALCSVH
jgi:hypothetical protein